VVSGCGAILLGIVVFSASAYQRGGAAIGRGSGNSGCEANPDGPALCREETLPPASNPAVKAKLDHEQNIKDAARLVELAGEVQRDLENGGEFTVSVGTVKKSEEMEKLSKKLHDRLKSGSAAAPKPPGGADAAKPGR